MYPAVVVDFPPNNCKRIGFFAKQRMECFVHSCLLKFSLLNTVIGLANVRYTDDSVEKSLPLSHEIGRAHV